MIVFLLAAGLLMSGEVAGAGDPSEKGLTSEDQEIVENLDLLENIEMLPALGWLMQGDEETETRPEEVPEKMAPKELHDGEKP